MSKLNQSEFSEQGRAKTLQESFNSGKSKRYIAKKRTLDEASNLGWPARLLWVGKAAVLFAAVLSPWAYGAWEFWAQWWITLALLVGIACLCIETALGKRTSQVFPLLFFPILAGLLLGFLQLVNWPDWLANTIAGKQIELASAFSSTPERFQTISVDYEGTWHQIRLLTLALTGVLLGSRCFRKTSDLIFLMSVFSINGVALGCFGIYQKLTFNGKIYWVKELTLGGSPFGPFVNRNNASGYLMICLACAIGLATTLFSRRRYDLGNQFAEYSLPFWQQVRQKWLDFLANLTADKIVIFVAVGALSVSIFAALSRGGVVAFLIGTVATILAYGMARKPKNSSFIFIPVFFFIAVLLGALLYGDRLADRFERIDLANVADNDIRIRHWRDTFQSVQDFGLMGSGLGSYKNVHRSYRNEIETIVFHFAENQFFQALVEAGWVGLLLFILAWWLALKYANLMLEKGKSDTTIGIGVMGMFLISSQAIASLFDFGFYIPSNLIGLSVLFGFMAYHAQSLGGRVKHQWLHFELSRDWVLGIGILLFGGLCLIAVDLFSRSMIQNQLKPRLVFLDQTSMSLEEVDKKLSVLIPSVKKKPTSEGLKYAAGLLVYKARLQLLHEQQDEIINTLETLTEDERKSFMKRLWGATKLQCLHDHCGALAQESNFSVQQFVAQPAIQENLPLAAQLLSYSLEHSLLQPSVHIRLGQIHAILDPDRQSDVDFERAVKAAPTNPNFRLITAVYYLQTRRPALAGPHIRSYLELKPLDYLKVLEVLNGRSNRSFPPVDPRLIADQMLPDDPGMLLTLARDYFPEGSPKQLELLDRVIDTINAVEYPNQKQFVLLGNAQQLQGKKTEAVESFSNAIIRDPFDRKTRYKRANLLVELNRIEEALEDAKRLKESKPKTDKFTKFHEKLQKMKINSNL